MVPLVPNLKLRGIRNLKDELLHSLLGVDSISYLPLYIMFFDLTRVYIMSISHLLQLLLFKSRLRLLTTGSTPYTFQRSQLSWTTDLLLTVPLPFVCPFRGQTRSNIY